MLVNTRPWQGPITALFYHEILLLHSNYVRISHSTINPLLPPHCVHTLYHLLATSPPRRAARLLQGTSTNVSRLHRSSIPQLARACPRTGRVRPLPHRSGSPPDSFRAASPIPIRHPPCPPSRETALPSRSLYLSCTFLNEEYLQCLPQTRLRRKPGNHSTVGEPAW